MNSKLLEVKHEDLGSKLTCLQRNRDATQVKNGFLESFGTPSVINFK